MNFRRRLALLIDPSVLDYKDLGGSDYLITPTINELVTEQLKGIVVDTGFIDEMSPEQRLDFCEKASDVYKNPTFKRTLDYLISQQVDFTVKRAESMEQVLFGRATINGLSLAKEEFLRLAALAEEEKPVLKMTKAEENEVI